MHIPFSLPLIDEPVHAEMHDCLTNTGWLTSGPKVIELEKEVTKITGVPTVCVNSWTSGAMLMLRWFGVGPGDEVIVPAYTYVATALCAMNIGAKVVMVDVGEDFNINVSKITSSITPNTKAIIPVDVGGWPCDYSAIMELVNNTEIKNQFRPGSERQEKLGRPLVLSDAAHSIGATFGVKPIGAIADITVMSFHSVKNITTGEGGGICLNLPEPFDNAEEYQFLKYFSLNGQTKSAFEKNQAGGWRYDIVAQGMKVNLPDVCAAIGLAQIRRYLGKLLPERKAIFRRYSKAFGSEPWAILPPYENEEKSSSCHLYQLKVRDIEEHQRDKMIEFITSSGAGVNVHYIPMPMLTLFKNLGYRMEDYPVAYENYKGEISLPIYNGLSNDNVDFVIQMVKEAYAEVVK